MGSSVSSIYTDSAGLEILQTRFNMNPKLPQLVPVSFFNQVDSEVYKFLHIISALCWRFVFFFCFLQRFRQKVKYYEPVETKLKMAVVAVSVLIWWLFSFSSANDGLLLVLMLIWEL